MQKNLLDYILCPSCKHSLRLQKDYLICTHCKKTYKIDKGVSILTDFKKTPDYITHQISYFEEEGKTRPSYALDEWQKSYLERFYDNIKTHKGAVILDIACGSGYMAVELAKTGAIVIACDITISQLHKLAKIIKYYKLEKNLFLVCCSAENLPFKNKIADIVIENSILEHLPKEKEAIREIDRVAKKKAALMISAPLDYKYIWPFLIPINLWHDKKIGHLRRYTKRALVKKIPSFSLERIYYTGHLVKFLFFLISQLLKTKKFDSIAEKIDKKFERFPYGGTVITAFFDR